MKQKNTLKNSLANPKDRFEIFGKSEMNEYKL